MCELYFLGISSEELKSSNLSEFNNICTSIKTVGIVNLVILGAPIGDVAIAEALVDKTADLERLYLRLKSIEAHHASFSSLNLVLQSQAVLYAAYFV